MTREGVQDRLLSGEVCTRRMCLAPSPLCKTVKENPLSPCAQSLDAGTLNSYLRIGRVLLLPLFVSLCFSVLCKLFTFYN